MDSSKIDLVGELVDNFSYNIKQYKNVKYDEANTRVDFIDKFFEILDWDVRNVQGFSEIYRDVVREDKVTILGKPKAPDYSFRIGGVRKFFVEAKKPAVNIKEDFAPAYQLRRYAYTAKLPLSILTDFEEFAVYDTRIKPSQTDAASNARIFFCAYKEYLSNFDFIYSTFSKHAVLKGSFDKYAEDKKAKRGTSEVDKEFLKLIDEWRTEFAKNIALRNKNLEVFDLNYAIQKIIDRIIFLRIAEDRRMEEYGTLQLAGSSLRAYEKICHLFRKANDKYNSGLFKVEPWLDELIFDDKTIKYVVDGLYYPQCPYELSVMPIEILGNIYEQFLGKTIRLTPSHQAKIEEKPEVRKAGGVYYTPKYIVYYIVENTVGEKIKEQAPKQIESIKILDPACGSGSFLVGAYQYILNYHLIYYTKEENIKNSLKKGFIYQIDENTYKLSIQVKQNILLNNIFGVDIDSQAVEVTKLSLLLKLMEDENIERTGQIFKYSDLKILPDLKDNIKCGNSLIGSDFYRDKNLELFSKEDMRKINAFDWDQEFKEIMKSGGFDCVIGNPPYGAELKEEEKSYLLEKFQFKNSDTACLFMGLSTQKILKTNGISSFIVPKPFVYSSNWKVIRELFISNLSKLADCGKVWKNVKLEQVIYVYYKDKTKNEYISLKREKEFFIDLGKIEKNNFKEFGFFLNGISDVELNIGLKIRNSGKFLNDFIINQRGAIYQKYITDAPSKFKVLGGKQLNRYYISQKQKGFISDEYLLDDKCFITNNSILVQNIVAHIENPTPHIKIIATIPKEFFYNNLVILDTINQLINSSNLKSEFLLGILNSKLISWYVYMFIFGKAIRTMHFDNPITKRIPVPNITLSKNCNKNKHDSIVDSVNQMLELQSEYQNKIKNNDSKSLKQKINLLDNQIDRMVYELYGLTEKEIKIIENY